MLMRVMWLAAAIVSILFAPPAAAAMLAEGEMDGQALRLVVDREAGRALVSVGGRRSLVDLQAGHVYLSEGVGGMQRVHARYRPGYGEGPDYEIAPWGPGPMIAGHASFYHVVTLDGQICAEVLISGWMKPFIEPAAQALSILEQLHRPRIEEPCARIPFATYAAAGWPLMAGKIDHPIFTTSSIRFDYQPAGDELALPTQFEDVGPEALARLAAMSAGRRDR